MAWSTGPVALVGSGEFLEVMTAVDAGLLAGRPKKVAVLPTAASLEGEERVGWWLDLARRHYEAMEVECVPVPVSSRADADDAGMAGLVEGAGLVYLSGGDPHHLASTLRGSLVWDAVLAAWHGGAALAGCSAGAMALTSGAPPDLGPGGAGSGRIVPSPDPDTGSRAGADVIQVYVEPPKGGAPRPVRELKAFTKITLNPGASKSVTLQIPRADLAYWNPETKSWVVTPGGYTARVGDSSRNLPLKAEFSITN